MLKQRLGAKIASKQTVLLDELYGVSNLGESLIPVADRFMLAHPEVADALAALGHAGISSGVIGSTASFLVAGTLGLSEPPLPRDTDVLIRPDDAEEVAELLGGRLERVPLTFTDSGGRRLACEANTVIASVGPDIIHAVGPLTPLVLGDLEYDTSLDLGSERHVSIDTSGGPFILALPEALTLYGVLQREGDGKNDLWGAAVLSLVCDPTVDCGRGLDQRVWDFLGRANGLLAPNT